LKRFGAPGAFRYPAGEVGASTSVVLLLPCANFARLLLVGIISIFRNNDHSMTRMTTTTTTMMMTRKAMIKLEY
jgi:hypothetical protein